jgi:hypothetical protein
LCGGVGEWMHRSLGGIAPATAGYASVTIAPQVSKSIGPSAVNATVATVRGTVRSAWVRPSNLSVEPFELWVSVPVGAHAVVRVPALLEARHMATARLVEVGEADLNGARDSGGGGVELWPPLPSTGGGAVAQQVEWLVAAAQLVGSDDHRAIELGVSAGEFHFQLFPPTDQ